MWHNVLDRKLDIASRLLTIVTSDGQASPVVNRSNRHFCRRPVRAQLIFHTSLTVFFVTFFLLLQRTILDAWDTHTSDTAQTHPLDSRSTVTGILPMILAVDTNSAALFFLYIDKSKPPSNDRAMYPQNSVWLKKKKTSILYTRIRTMSGTVTYVSCLSRPLHAQESTKKSEYN